MGDFINMSMTRGLIVISKRVTSFNLKAVYVAVIKQVIFQLLSGTRDKEETYARWIPVNVNYWVALE